MYRIFSRTTAALGLSLALSLSALGVSTTPARADNGDAAAVIGGIIALYAIGRAIDNRNDRRDSSRVHRNNNVHIGQSRLQRHHGHQPRRSRQALIAPSRCIIEGRDYNGNFRGYERRCMLNRVSSPRFLPDNCLRRVHTHRGERLIYGGRCLGQNGWVRG